MTTSRSEPAPALDQGVKTDIAIVGAGFTGLWTAVFLKDLDASTDVVVLERETAGYGASGRNAGILSETIDHSHSLAVTHFGLEEARRLVTIGKQNLEEMAAFLTANQVDADHEPTGRLHVALTTAHTEEIQKSIEAEKTLGITGAQYLDVDAVRDEIHSPLYLGGAFFPSGGILNPVKLAHGLKRVALNRGVRFFERTDVVGLQNASVKTSAGSVQANKIILATDAYTHHLYPKLLKYFIPLYDYIIVSEPLTDAELKSIGWRNRQGVTDGRTFFNYYRLTRDNRIVWGTSEAKYYAPNRVDASCDHSEAHYAGLRESFRRHFPQLQSLKFPFAWGGPIASTTRLTPFFGSTQKGRLVYALGYTGHGIGSTRIAAKILAHLALEKRCELLDLSMVRKKPFPYPPEPLRSWAVHLVTRSLRRVDEGKKPGLLLSILDKLRIGFSS
jgi:glycine/D-amino acid oxidase-like deaminating enzyme